MLVIALYLLANVAYLVHAAVRSDSDRAERSRRHRRPANVIFPGAGATIMAVAIMISTFGCNNGLILAGARAYYAMARDGLFFRRGELNNSHVPAWGLVIQGIWAGAAGAAAHGQDGRRRHTSPLRQPLRQPARLRHLRRR